jgi:hypothetical protein
MKKPCILILVALCIVSAPWAFHEVSGSMNAQIQHVTTYVDMNGDYHIVGEVQNTGNVWLTQVRISATLRDQNGSIIDFPAAYTYLNNIPPATPAGFDVMENSAADSALVNSYTLNLEYHTSQPLRPVLYIYSVNATTDLFKRIVLTGLVQNSGDVASEGTRVVGTFYDAGGNVVYVGFTPTDPATIPGGYHQPFQMTVTLERTKLVTSWSLQAEGQQYTSIPETPIPAIILAVVFLTTMFVIRSKNTPSMRTR